MFHLSIAAAGERVRSEVKGGGATEKKREMRRDADVRCTKHGNNSPKQGKILEFDGFV